MSAERDLGMAHRPVRVVLARGVQLCGTHYLSGGTIGGYGARKAAQGWASAQGITLPRIVRVDRDGDGFAVIACDEQAEVDAALRLAGGGAA